MSCSQYTLSLWLNDCRYASTFQMLRGTLVLWAGLLTIVVLHRRLHIHNWFGMVLIVAGAAIVGASRYIFLLHTLYLHVSKITGFASTSNRLLRLRHAPVHLYRCPSRAQTHVALCSIIYDRGVPSHPPSLAGAVQVRAQQAVSFNWCCCISCHCLSFVCSFVHDITVKLQVPCHWCLTPSLSCFDILLTSAWLCRVSAKATSMQIPTRHATLFWGTSSL